MIQVRVPEIHERSGRVYSLGPTSVSPRLKGISCFASLESPVSYLTYSNDRVGSRMIQGNAFDRFNNKSVWHAHVDITGTLYQDRSTQRGYAPMDSYGFMDGHRFTVAPAIFMVSGKPCISNFDTWETFEDTPYHWTDSDGGEHPAYTGYISGTGGTFSKPNGTLHPWWGYAVAHWSALYQPEYITLSLAMSYGYGTSSSSQAVYRNQKMYYGFSKWDDTSATQACRALARIAAQTLSYHVWNRWGSSTGGQTALKTNAISPFIEAPSSMYAQAVGIRLANRYLWLAENMPWPRHSWSDVAVKCVDGNSVFRSNLLAYIADLKSVGGTLHSALDFVSGAKGGVKGAASLWLSARYGDRLTVADSKDLLHSLQKAMTEYMANYSIGRGSYVKSALEREFLGETFWGYHARWGTMILHLDSYTPLMTAIKRLMDWDAWPSLENTWDLIPFSFCVDWLTGFSKLLNAIDAAIKAPYLRPISQYASERLWYHRKTTRREEEQLLDVWVVKYHRAPRNLLGDISPLDTELDPTLSAINLIDGAALALTG